MNKFLDILTVVWRVLLFLLGIAGIGGLAAVYLTTGDPILPIGLLFFAVMYAAPFVGIIFLVVYVFKIMREGLKK